MKHIGVKIGEDIGVKVGVGASGGFSPKSIANLKLWLDSNIDLIETGTGASSWGDQSDEGNNVSQSVDSSRPTITLDAINGYPSVDFNGSSDIMLMGGVPFALDNVGTLFFVAKVGIGAGLLYILSQGDDANNNNHMAFRIRDNIAENMTALSTIVGAADLSKVVEAISTNWIIGCIQSTGTKYNMWLNGESKTVSGTDNGEWFSDQTNPNDDTAIGAMYRSSPLFGNGSLTEELYYSSVLTTDEVANVFDYLNSKFNIY